MKILRKISAFVLAASLVVVMNSPRTFAGSSSNEVGRYRLNVSCYDRNASFSITERGSATGPTGHGTLKYTRYGDVFYKHITGTSWPSYWEASHSTEEKSIRFIKARTHGYGKHVTASN